VEAPQATKPQEQKRNDDEPCKGDTDHPSPVHELVEIGWPNERQPKPPEGRELGLAPADYPQEGFDVKPPILKRLESLANRKPRRCPTLQIDVHDLLTC
jgi:hypothetical protein